jgi:hypothetical protein
MSESERRRESERERRRTRVREIRRRIRDVLIGEWDPRRVGGDPARQGEYDFLIEDLYHFLSRFPSRAALLLYLLRLELWMGVAPPKGDRTRAVNRLFLLRLRFREG